MKLSVVRHLAYVAVAVLLLACGGSSGTDPDMTATDSIAPIVTIIAPGSDTVRGSITVAAAASDNVAVIEVLFFIDGSQRLPVDSLAPYTYVWNTVNSVNGVHSISAVAKDKAGNWGLSPIIDYTVANAAATSN